ncbi:oxidoreductase [Paenibacillus piri]|uniref:Oxidoreductase n=1 Tax=Paenibacillus piri TaxID=2547395 RepID=A0A4R5KH68_9BACL|nr:oxidoreductase [Paenibacillus piri]TDF94088.1 oxidoreductase [Paenibacillus piri]
MEGRTAVVAGATGLIGGELVRMLLADPYYGKVAVLVRNRMDMANEKLLQVTVDYEQLEASVHNLLTGADVFCCLGTTIKKAGSQEQFRKVDYDYPMTLGRLSQQDGAVQYSIVTAMGAGTASSFFYSRVKGEVEEGLARLRLPALHIFRPSLLLGDRQEVRTGERIGSAVSGLITPLMIGGLRKYRPIQAKTVARAMVHASKHGGSGVRIYESDQIEALGRQG